MQFDYIIVGAGSAGCLLANRLSKSGTKTVCLLEAGPSDWSPFIKIPAGFMKTVSNKKLNWLYATEPSWGTHGRRIPTPRGKVIGGSSSINGLIFSRGQKMDFDHWAQLGNNGWGYDDLLPHFRSLENYITNSKCDQNNGLSNNFRGRDGEMVVTDLGWRDPLCDAFIRAAREIGIPYNYDYNENVQEGVSYVQRTSTGKLRMSSSRAYLKPILKRRNLFILKNALVTKILFENKAAVGVAYKIGGSSNRLQFIKANLEVIVSAGAINTPQLLQLSGVGSGKLLKGLGIEVVHNLPGVGENLRDHYATRLTARAKNVQTINEVSRGSKLLFEILKYGFGNRSILSLGPTLVYCFWHSDEQVKNNDLQITFTPASYDQGQQSKLDRKPGFSIAAWPQRPQSFGWVRIKTSNPYDSPLIQPNYLSSEEDVRVLLSGIKLSRKLMHTHAMEPYFDYEVYPGKTINSDSELLEIARKRSTTAYHLMGSCRMGPNTDPTAVVDDNLRVYGLKNLRVIDASIMPMIPSANINAAVLAVAEKGSNLINTS